MKKIFGLLLAIGLIAMLVVTPMSASAADVDIDMGEGVVFTPGDINGDDSINLKDLVLIAQKAANWEVNPVIAALDTDGSGKFDAGDVVCLARYLAGYDVVLNDVAYVA